MTYFINIVNELKGSFSIRLSLANTVFVHMFW